jgi:hypothetical protein
MPVLPHRNDSEAEACCRTQEGCYVGRRLDAPSDNHDDRADNRRRCKKVDPQNGRNFGEQDIPDRISARPADRAHHDGGDRRQPKRQSLFGPIHSEQRQAKSIYDDENVFRNLLNNVECEERREGAQKSCCHDWPPADRLGRRLANENIAHDAAARRRRKGHDDNAEGVQSLVGSDLGTLDRQNEGSSDIDELQQSSLASAPVISHILKSP